MNGSKNHETPPLSKREVPDTNQFLSAHNYSFWILPNPLGKTQKIPMQGLWQNFLPKQRHRLSPPPTSPSHVRSGCLSQRRGCEQVCHRPSSADRMEHRGSLAGESCCLLSSLQP